MTFDALMQSGLVAVLPMLLFHVFEANNPWRISVLRSPTRWPVWGLAKRERKHRLTGKRV